MSSSVSPVTMFFSPSHFSSVSRASRKSNSPMLIGVDETTFLTVLVLPEVASAQSILVPSGQQPEW